MKLPRLTPTQKQYIWLAGEYGLITQGVGVRSSNGVISWHPIMNGKRAVVNGYSNPAEFLKGHGLLEWVEGISHTYRLTEHGRAMYERLKAKGYKFGK